MKSAYVQTGPVRLRYVTHGQDPELVVFVHGYSASARHWRLPQEALDSHRFCTIADKQLGSRQLGPHAARGRLQRNHICQRLTGCHACLKFQRLG